MTDANTGNGEVRVSGFIDSLWGRVGGRDDPAPPDALLRLLEADQEFLAALPQQSGERSNRFVGHSD